MPLVREYLRRLWATLRRSPTDHDLERELRFHLEQAEEELRGKGHCPAEAARLARVRLGGFPQTMAALRDQRGLPWLDDLRTEDIISMFSQDLRLARYALSRRRGWTAAAVVALTIGVAGFTLAVSLLEQVLVRPLNFPNGRELLTLYVTSGPRYSPMPYDDYTQFRTRLDDGLDLAAFWRVFMPVSGGAFPERNQGEFVTGNFFSVLGVRPALGRLVMPSDNIVPNGHPVVVLSDRLWRRQFASDPQVLGKQLRLDGLVYDIIGVAPEGFRGTTFDSNFWIPAMMVDGHFPGRRILTVPSLPIFQTVGRLTPPLTLSAAQALMEPLDALLAEGRVPPYYTDTQASWRVRAFPGHYLRLWPEYRDDVAVFLTIFGVMALAALVVACANVATLLLARSTEWKPELALRYALGASRADLFRRVGTEVALLLLISGLVAVVLIHWLSSLTPLVPLPVPVQLELILDWAVLSVGLAVIAAVALFFAAPPVYQVVRHSSTVRMSARTQSVSRSTATDALVVGQVAISVCLVMGCFLLVSSAWRISGIAPGFDARHGVSGSLDLPRRDDDTLLVRNTLIARLLHRLTADSRVSSASVSHSRPLSVNGRLQVEFSHSPGGQEPVTVSFNSVTTDYFRTFGIPLRSGRLFTHTEAMSGARVVVVNRVLADRHFSGRSPLGESLRIEGEDRPRQIVGVVGDTSGRDIRVAPAPFVYLPLYQGDAYEVELGIAFRRPSTSGAALLRQHVAELGSRIPVSRTRTFDEIRAAATAESRIQALLAGVLAGVALSLAFIGLYGLVTYWIRQRKRELGIRIALGATPGDIARLVVGRVCWLAIIGSIVGIGVGIGMSGVVARALHGQAAGDVLGAVVVALLSVVVMVAASCWPAWRAGRVAPRDCLTVE